MSDLRKSPVICACGDHAFVFLTMGQTALIDISNIDLIAGRCWHAWVNPKAKISYALSYDSGPQLRMHRVILGEENSAIMVDHKNGDGLDNRLSNLRIATNSQNQMNSKIRRHNTVGFKGVRRKNSRFAPRIKVNGQDINPSNKTFATPEEAARAYDKAARKYFGEYAMTNEDLGLFDQEEV